VYNRIVQWNRVSYEQAEGLVLDHRSANLEFINFRNEIFIWTAQQRAQGVTTLESSPAQRFAVVEVINDSDLQQQDATAPPALPERVDMPFDSNAGMVYPVRGVQAWVESQALFMPSYEGSEIPCQAAPVQMSHFLPPAAVSTVPRDFDSTVQGSRTSEVTDRPQPSSAVICCRRPVFFDASIMEPVYIPDAGSITSSESNLPPGHGGGPTAQVDAEGGRPPHETVASSSPVDQAHSSGNPGEDVASPRTSEHDSHDSPEDEPSEPRRDKGKGRAVDPPSPAALSEDFFMFADLSAAGPSSLGAKMAAIKSDLRPNTPIAITEYDDPRTYSYPLGPLLTPAVTEMESQQKDIVASASFGAAQSPLDRLIGALNRLSERTPGASPIPAPMPGSPPLSSSWSSLPKTRQEEAELAGGRLYAINEILDRRGLGGTGPSSPEGFVRVDSFPPAGIEAGTSGQDALQDRLQGQHQDQGVIVDDANGILSCHSERGVPTAGSHICRPTPGVIHPIPLDSSVTCSSSNGPTLQESQPIGLPHQPPGRMYVYVRFTNSYADVPAPKKKDVVHARAAHTQSCRFLQDEAQSLRKYRSIHHDYRGFDFDEEDREIAREEYRRYLASLPQPPRFHIDDTPEGTVAASSNRTLDDASSQWDFNSEDQTIADRNGRRFQSLVMPPPSNVFRRTTRSIGKLWKSTLHVLKIKKKKKPTGRDGNQQGAETEEPLSATTTLVCSETSDVPPGRVAMEVTVASLRAGESQVSLFSQPRYALPELPSLVLTAPFVPLEERRPGLRQGRVAAHIPASLDPLPSYSEIDPARVRDARSSEDVETSELPKYMYVARPVRRNRLVMAPRFRRTHLQSPVTPERVLIAAWTTRSRTQQIS